VEIEDDAAAGFGDHAHGLVEDLAAMAVGGEDVARGAAGVDADEHGMRAGGCAEGSCGQTQLRVGFAGNDGRAGRREGGAVGAEVAADQGDVAFAAVDFALVGDHAELAVAGLDAGLAGATM
jgi:hypothetical protein